MPNPNDEMRRRELERRREQEIKDLETERTIGPRPLEGLSGAGAGTTWTDQQDERAAADVHAADEVRARERSEKQIPDLPAEGEQAGEPEPHER